MLLMATGEWPAAQPQRADTFQRPNTQQKPHIFVSAQDQGVCVCVVSNLCKVLLVCRLH